jgi:glycosyltransferase involved in cell wall biosynthesis
MRISAIVPCLNEEGNIKPAYARISKALCSYDDYEILFIDDGSTDDSLKIIRSLADTDPRIKYISFSRNFGLEAAFRVGFLHAAFEWCIQYDADMQSPPEETYKLVEKANEGYDVIFGIRKNRNDSRYRVWGSKCQQFIARYLFNIKIPMGASVFRMIRTDVARKVINCPTRTAYFIATIPLVTSYYATVEVEHQRRSWGKSNWNMKKMIKHSIELFVGFSNRLLDLTLMNAIVFFIIFIIAIFLTIYGKSLSLILLILCFISLLQMLSISIIAQYIKYPMSNSPYHEQVHIRDTNIHNDF